MPNGTHPSSLGRNSVYMIASQISIAVLQALLFLLIARSLGPHEFGKVASAVAITSALLPFSGLGLGNIAIMRLARGQGEAALFLGNALMVATVTGGIGIGLATLIGVGFFSDPGTWVLIALFGLSEILVTKYIDIAAHVFYGLERHATSAVFYNLHIATRLVFALSLYLSPAPTALQWAVLHVVSGVVILVVVTAATVRRIGRPHVRSAEAWADARQGVFFSVMLSSKSVHTDIDKAVLARYASMEIGGAYTAAYRVVYMAFLPVVAALVTVQGRMFREGGAAGVSGALGAVARLALLATMYCLGLVILIYAAAPVVPWLLGDAYALSSDVLKALCFLPLVLMVPNILTQALTGADGQKIAALLHAGAAFVALALNLVLVPVMSWQGSVLATYATQVLLAAALSIAIAFLRHESHARGRKAQLESLGS